MHTHIKKLFPVNIHRGILVSINSLNVTRLIVLDIHSTFRLHWTLGILPLLLSMRIKCAPCPTCRLKKKQECTGRALKAILSNLVNRKVMWTDGQVRGTKQISLCVLHGNPKMDIRCNFVRRSSPLEIILTREMHSAVMFYLEHSSWGCGISLLQHFYITALDMNEKGLQTKLLVIIMLRGID